MSEQRPLIAEYEAHFGDDPEYVLERVYLRLTEDIHRYMEQHGVSQAELARRLGVSQARVSRIFKETTNLTLKTLARICVALQGDIEFSMLPRQSLQQPEQQLSWPEAKLGDSGTSAGRLDQETGEAVQVSYAQELSEAVASDESNSFARAA